MFLLQDPRLKEEFKAISRICKYLSENGFDIFIFLTGDFIKEKDFELMHKNYDFGKSKYLKASNFKNFSLFSIILTDRNTPFSSRFSRFKI